ncbi:hypothetical protein [Pararobbsia alpina]|uniref:hypothetical protein n=1 Tax=Pararobbsia alpina TaxID=621374 RepID=UPI0015820980|nr:hypothetical protein [Pararobbsia alpina]
MSKFDISSLIGKEVRVYLDLTPGNHCWSIAEPKSSGRVLFVFRESEISVDSAVWLRSRSKNALAVGTNTPA